jgi:ferredoxin
MSCFDLFKDHSLWCRNCLVSCKKAVYIDVILAMAMIDLFNLLQLLLFWHMHSGPLQNRVRSGCALSYKDTRLATFLNNLVNNLPGPSSHNKRNWLLSQAVAHDTFVREIVWFPPLQCTTCGICLRHVENKDCNLILQNGTYYTIAHMCEYLLSNCKLCVLNVMAHITQ